jgi:hypothetical protein
MLSGLESVDGIERSLTLRLDHIAAHASPADERRAMRKSVTKDRLAVFDEAKDQALSTEKAVRVFAGVMADMLAEFYTVPYRVHIDPEDGFVVVRPK